MSKLKNQKNSVCYGFFSTKNNCSNFFTDIKCIGVSYNQAIVSYIVNQLIMQNVFIILVRYKLFKKL